MAEQTREFLKQEFKDSAKPSGEDFAHLMDSFLNKADDVVGLDADSTLVLAGGLGLGNSARNQAGFLRFDGTSVQFHDGTGWQDLGSGGGGAFEAVDGGADVAYAGGNVGIGTFAPGSPPTFRLEVDLGENAGEADRARFGNLVASNGPGGLRNDALVYHRAQNPQSAYALRQRQNGEVRLNAPAERRIRFEKGGNQTRMAITEEGNVVVGASSEVTNQAFVFQVRGAAFKTEGGEGWNSLCDARLKEDVRDLDAGLEQLLQVRPVRFRYNGKAGTTAGHPGVGILGQEIEQVFPEMVTRAPSRPGDGLEVDDLRVYNGSGLTYVLINAVKELAAKVERLEAALAGTRPQGQADGCAG